MKVDYGEAGDRQLIACIIAKDQIALRELYMRHFRSLLAQVERMTHSHDMAQEAINDTFNVVWNKADSFQTEAEVKPWLFGIARNCAKRLNAREQKQQRIKESIHTSDHSENITPLLDERATNNRWLNQAMAQLPAEQRTAFSLRYELGFTVDEISRVMECPTNTTKGRLRYAKERLRTTLNGATSLPSGNP